MGSGRPWACSKRLRRYVGVSTISSSTTSSGVVSASCVASSMPCSSFQFLLGLFRAHILQPLNVIVYLESRIPMRHKPGQDQSKPLSLIFRIQSCYTWCRCYSGKHNITAFLIAISPCAEVAQLAEHSPEKAGVGSSILPLGTISLSPARCVLLNVPHVPCLETRLTVGSRQTLIPSEAPAQIFWEREEPAQADPWITNNVNFKS